MNSEREDPVDNPGQKTKANPIIIPFGLLSDPTNCVKLTV